MFACTRMTEKIPRVTCVTARRCSTSSLQPRSLPMRFSQFAELKKDIRERRFASDEDVYDWVKNRFGRHFTSFFKNGTGRLVSLWNKYEYINSVGDYCWGNICSILNFRFWPEFIWLSIIHIVVLFLMCALPRFIFFSWFIDLLITVCGNQQETTASIHPL